MPLITTNYDDLIEQVTGLKHVTWQEPHLVTRVVRREDRRVVHLHGHWEHPDSVILGLHSYVGISENRYTQAVMNALGVGTSFLFVGCGDEGLDDPNWGPFLDWLTKHDTGAKNQHRHYRLVREQDRSTPMGRLVPLAYGTDYAELAGFLRELQPEDAVASAERAAAPLARVKVSDCVSDYVRRFQGYYRQGVPLGAKFAEFHVRPLDDDQIRQFVTDWFSTAYQKLYGFGDNASTRASEVREKLLKILSLPRYQTGGMRELCTNPLLLTILCIVFHEERKMPTERAELYARCVRVLLEHWRRELYDGETGGDVKAYDAEAAQSVLARIAWWMHQQQDRTAAPLDELAAEAEQGLAPVAASSGLGRDGHAFIDRMRDEAGILAMSGEGDGRCGFLHLSFQEFLAADHAANEGLAKTLAPRAAESWWRETALLSLRCSRPYCESFFAEILKAGIAENHPDLAEQCLARWREGQNHDAHPHLQSSGSSSHWLTSAAINSTLGSDALVPTGPKLGPT